MTAIGSAANWRAVGACVSAEVELSRAEQSPYNAVTQGLAGVAIV